jgi:DNA-binding winged helix-turn-helix (wHTH) protein
MEASHLKEDIGDLLNRIGWENSVTVALHGHDGFMIIPWNGGDEFVIEHKPFVFTFADVEVREREFCIVKAGEVLPVEPKAFRVLVFLLRNPHRLITKDELLDAVWNDCAVSENSLTRSIAHLRRLLGDDTREPRYIATVPTVGYRFLCDVKAEEDGFRGVDAADLHHTDTGNGFEALKGMIGVQSSSNGPQDQTAVAERVKETVQQPTEEGGRRSRRLLVRGLIAATLVILVMGFLFYGLVSNRDAPRAATVAGASSRMSIVPLTNLPGAVWDPAFSPDGEKIAFVWDGENPVKGDLYVQLVGGEKPLRLTHTSSGFTCCADWSRDGRKIAFGRCDDTRGRRLYGSSTGWDGAKTHGCDMPFRQRRRTKMDRWRKIAIARRPLRTWWPKRHRRVFTGNGSQAVLEW